MTKKIALTASVVMLIAISGAAAAGAPRAHPDLRSAYTTGRAANPFKSFDTVAFTSAREPNGYRYHGGPKSNY